AEPIATRRDARRCVSVRARSARRSERRARVMLRERTRMTDRSRLTDEGRPVTIERPSTRSFPKVRSMRATSIALAVLATLILHAPGALAQPSVDDERARLHFEAGRSYHEEGNYEAALAEFRR